MDSKKPVSLKFLAEHLGLSATTVSLVLNKSARASSIPQHTKERVLEAARTFNYRPNFFARALTNKQSFTVAVVVPEISEGYGASILAAIERRLAREANSAQEHERDPVGFRGLEVRKRDGGIQLRGSH